MPGLTDDLNERYMMEGDIANRLASRQYYRDAKAQSRDYFNNLYFPTGPEFQRGFQQTVGAGEGGLANQVAPAYGADPALGAGPSSRSIFQAGYERMGHRTPLTDEAERYRREYQAPEQNPSFTDRIASGLRGAVSGLSSILSSEPVAGALDLGLRAPSTQAPQTDSLRRVVRGVLPPSQPGVQQPRPDRRFNDVLTVRG